MKKILSVLSIALFCASMVFAGGAQEAQPATATKGETAPKTAVAATPKYLEDNPTAITGTVKFWTAFKGSQGMDDLIAAFNKVYPNVKVELNSYSNNSNGNVGVDTALMAGGKIDVLHTFGQNNTFRRLQNSLFLDITDKLASDGLDVKKEWGSDKYAYEGRYYTIPLGGLSNYIAINMDEWHAAGYTALPTEWTWDEYLEASKKMTHGEGDKKVYGGSDYHSVNYFAYPVRQVKGYDAYYKDDGTSNFDDPLMLEALKREIQAEQVDKIWFPLTVYRSDSIQSHMVYCNHQVASVIMPNLVRFIRDPKYAVSWQTGFAPYPVEKKGQTNYMAPVAIFSHAGIAKDCKDVDAAWAFLKFFATYGDIYLVPAGHMPTWKKTDLDNAMNIIFGSEAEAKKLVDIDSFKRVVFNYSGDSYVETNSTAITDIEKIVNQYILDAHAGKISPEDALKQIKVEADQAIKDAQ
jgi:multiple sugar transport system substrate-binding protein